MGLMFTNSPQIDVVLEILHIKRQLTFVLHKLANKLLAFLHQILTSTTLKSDLYIKLDHTPSHDNVSQISR